MGATSRIVAAVMVGLAVTGCALTRQNNGVRLRGEPTTIAGAVATGSRPMPISRAAGCSLISRGSDAAAPVPVRAPSRRCSTIPV